MQDPTPILSLTDRIRDAALDLGFCRVGFTPATALTRDAKALQAWLDAGYHGGMDYMAQHRRDAPHLVQADARTLIVVALPYPRDPDAPMAPLRGTIARYARGADYHSVLRDKLQALATACETIVGRTVVSRPCVDTAPLLERGYAARAGVGFAAKSTLSIVPGIGTYVLLGELLVDLDLTPSRPATPKCGSCTRCLDACPTGAFVDAHVLDARRCISYLTIEMRGPIPRALRARMGTMIFGCDICQDVCPFNASKRARPAAQALFWRSELVAPSLVDFLTLGSAAYRKRVRGTALRRASREQLARNAAVALGNTGSMEAVPPLAEALHNHLYPIVRGHAAWALGNLGGHNAHSALLAAQERESDTFVQEEIAAALTAVVRNPPPAPATT